MGNTIMGAVVSLDGFIAGPDDRAGRELGRNGGRLFDWLADRDVTHLRYRVRHPKENA